MLSSLKFLLLVVLEVNRVLSMVLRNNNLTNLESSVLCVLDSRKLEARLEGSIRSLK